MWVVEMAYATVADWSARFGLLDENLDPTVVTDALDWATVQVDNLIGRRNMEPATHTDVLWEHQSRGDGRRVFLPDWPLRLPDRWFCTLTALELLDEYGESMQTVTVGDCVLMVELQGRVILPSANWVEDGWHVQATYDCGYGSAVGSPDIPEDLVAATLYTARTHVYEVLAAGRIAATDEDAPIWRSRAKQLLEPWRKVPVA